MHRFSQYNMRNFWIYFIFFCANLQLGNFQKFERHPEINLSIRQILKKYGYPFEVHEIITPDGYILQTYRVPHGKNSSKIGTPILFVPGTGGCAENFFILGKTKSLGYFLADKGFDLWFMNQRGTTASRKHKYLDAEKNPEEYWDFGWHEVGIYDTTSNIDYILNVTKREKLFYIGHSQGSSTYFVTLSERPEYNDKIITGIHLGLSVYIGESNIPLIQLLAKYNRLIGSILKSLNINYIMPNNNEFLHALKEFCSLSSGTAEVCMQIIAMMDVGNTRDDLLLNKTYTQIIFRDSPAGGSVKQLLHYFQLMESNKFRRYDYGMEGNLKKYGQIEPPDYDLKKCTAPVALFIGRADFILTDQGLAKFLNEIPNLVLYYEIKEPQFHHSDFIWGVADVVNLYFKQLYRFLKTADKKY